MARLPQSNIKNLNIKNLDKLNKKANSYYLTCLKRIESPLHKATTDSIELDSLGTQLFGARFGGVSARDEPPPFNTIKKKLIICNLDKRNSKGSHWVAMGDSLVYDSFGRSLDFKDFKQTDEDIEQLLFEQNCGQRCLAWLCVCFVYGRKGAALI